MKSFLALVCLLPLLTALSGCITQSAARERERIAYLQGQRDALMKTQQEQPKSGYITFIGPVQNHSVKWTDGLTLSQAIVKAGYTAPTDPKSVVIRRPDQEIQVDTRRLLQGENVPLQPGDIVEFQE